MEDAAGPGVEIYYDGECPLCAAYVRMLNLREAVGRVELIDARSGDPRLTELRAAGLDPEEGMILNHGGRLHHGAEAMRMLSILSASGGPLRALMRSPRRAALFYPVLRAGRRLLLRLMGRRALR